MRPIVIAGLVLSAFSSMPAQSISGRVLDKTTRAPLRKIAVRLVPDTGSVSTVLARTTTDSSGIFYVEAPGFGTYRFVFGLESGGLLSAPLVVKDSDVQKEYLIDLQAERSYFEFEVQRQAALMPNQAHPKYPQSLRAANVEGEVLVQFVVDADGHPQMWTFKVLRSSHPEFTQAVREAVPLMRFVPAELGGRNVKQLVQMPFVFGLNR